MLRAYYLHNSLHSLKKGARDRFRPFNLNLTPSFQCYATPLVERERVSQIRKFKNYQKIGDVAFARKNENNQSVGFKLFNENREKVR